MVYDNINCSDLVGKSMQRTDRSESQRLKPSPSHYLKPQDLQASNCQVSPKRWWFRSTKFHIEVNELLKLGLQPMLGADIKSQGLRWERFIQRTRQQVWAQIGINKVSCTAASLLYSDGQKHFMSWWCCVQGVGKTVLLLCRDFKDEHVFRSTKTKKNQIKIPLAMSSLIFLSVDQNQQDLFL